MSTSLSLWQSNGAPAIKYLGDVGIQAIGTKAANALVARVGDLTDFPARDIPEAPGWSGNAYFLPSGERFPKSGEQSDIGFRPIPNRFAQAGSMQGWLDEVATPLSRHLLPAFLMCAIFAAAMLRFVSRAENIGFDVTGRGGTGKATILRILAAMVGSPDASNPYWVEMDVTIAGLEETMKEHVDLPLILNEANLFGSGASESGLAKLIRDLVFKLASGTIKGRYNAPGTSRRLPFIYFVSSNDSHVEVLRSGRSEKVRAAAAERCSRSRRIAPTAFSTRRTTAPARSLRTP